MDSSHLTDQCYIAENKSNSNYLVKRYLANYHWVKMTSGTLLLVVSDSHISSSSEYKITNYADISMKSINLNII